MIINNINKTIVFLVIFVFVNFSITKSDKLPILEDQVVREICNQLYGEESSCTSDSCLFDFINCKTIDHGNSYYVHEIYLYNNEKINNQISVDVNFTVFSKIKYIVSEEIIVPNIWDHIPNLHHLKELTIFNQSNSIPKNITLPKDLNRLVIEHISIELPVNIFNGGLQYLEIKSGYKGFRLPNNIQKQNIILSVLNLPLNQYTSISNQFIKNLSAVTELTLTINNDNTIIGGYNQFKLPSLESFESSLVSLEIIFQNDKTNLQTWLFPQYLTKFKSLKDLIIKGSGFMLDSNIGFTNFSSFKQNEFYLSFCGNVDLITGCKSRPCIILPVDSRLSLHDLNVNMSVIDLNNVKELIVRNNQIKQELPFKDTSIISKSINLYNNAFIGKLYPKMCHSDFISVAYNNLIGDIPNCFKCWQQFRNGESIQLYPNKFNGNEYSVHNCTTFSIDKITNIVKTNGSIITITGTDFGWSLLKVSGLGDFKITIPNKEIEILVPNGIGRNHTSIVTFGGNGDKKLNVTFTFNYEQPIVKSYHWSNDKLFSINGNGFNFNSTNIVSINGNLFKFLIAYFNSNGDSTITLQDDQSVPVNQGDTFNISVIVGNQISNVIKFTLFNSISIYGFDQQFLTDGNNSKNITLLGDFKTSDSNIVNITINGTHCNIVSVNSTCLTINNYPILPVGKYTINLNIGGLLYFSSIEYYNPNDIKSNNAIKNSNIGIPSILFVILSVLCKNIFLSK